MEYSFDHLNQLPLLLEFFTNINQIKQQTTKEFQSENDRNNNPIYSIDVLINNPNSNLRGFQFEVNSSPNEFLSLYNVGGGITEDYGFDTGFNPNNGIVVGYDLDGGSILDTSGVLTKIDLTGYIGTESVQVCLSNVLLTGPTGWDLYPSEVGGCIIIENQLGDINYDGQFNVLDAVMTVQLVLEYSIPNEYEQWAADINADGNINIQDIVLVIDIILIDADLPRMDRLEAVELNVFTDKITISSNGIIAGAELHTSGDYTITGSILPEGWEYYNNNNIILIVDMDGTGISKEMTLYYDGAMQIKNSLISDWSGNGISANLNIIPDAYILEPAYPNPFNPTTNFSFALPVDSDILLSIYNMQGREVSRLIDGNMDAGYHSVTWYANSYSSGVYFVKMIAEDFSTTQKIMLIK